MGRGTKRILIRASGVIFSAPTGRRHVRTRNDHSASRSLDTGRRPDMCENSAKFCKRSRRTKVFAISGPDVDAFAKADQIPERVDRARLQRAPRRLFETGPHAAIRSRGRSPWIVLRLARNAGRGSTQGQFAFTAQELRGLLWLDDSLPKLGQRSRAASSPRSRIRARRSRPALWSRRERSRSGRVE
jgi:hypothetical protein